MQIALQHGNRRWVLALPDFLQRSLGALEDFCRFLGEDGLLESLGIEYHHIPVNWAGLRIEELERFEALMGALAGGPVWAESMRLSTLQMGGTLRVQDSLQVNSKPDRNLVENGFLAKTKADERHAGPSQRIMVVQAYKDVTKDMRRIAEDLVQGRVAVANAELDDFVLLRSDGSPTYMLAVVVDDHDMGITHVIRGDDHLNNAFRQLAIIRAMGWPEPTYAHVPLIHGADGAKLSKRHGALGVDAYRDMGYLPEAMRNYLALLGWGPEDQATQMSTDELIEKFDVARVPCKRFASSSENKPFASFCRSLPDAMSRESVSARASMSERSL